MDVGAAPFYATTNTTTKDVSPHDVMTSGMDQCDDNMTLHISLTIVYVTIAVFGMIGNILSYIVLHWKSEHNATNFLLKALSMTDTLFLFCAILRVSFTENWKRTKCDSFMTVVLGTLVVGDVMTIAQFVSVWLIVVLAFFRYEAICNPFRVRQWCNNRTARLSIVLVTLTGVLIWTPFMLEYDVRLINSHAHSSADMSSDAMTAHNGNLTDHTMLLSNKTLAISNETMLFGSSHSNSDYFYNLTNATHNSERQCYANKKRNWTKSEYYKWYDAAFAHIGSMFVVPFTALIVFNASMMKDLYCPNTPSRDRSAVSRRTREIHEITKVVFAIVLVFLVSYSMYFIFALRYYTSALDSVIRRTCNEDKLFEFLIRTVALLNSSVNFIIYYVLRKSFRRKVWRLVCSCDKQPAQPGNAAYSPSRDSRFYSYNKTTSLRVFRFTKRRHASAEKRSPNGALGSVRSPRWIEQTVPLNRNQ